MASRSPLHKVLLHAAFPRASFQLSCRTVCSAVQNARSCGWWFRTRRLQTRSFCELTSSSEPVIDQESLKKFFPEIHDPRDRPPPKDEDFTKSLQLLPIIHVHSTHNNTIFTITDHMGKVLAWTSAGTEGFRNTRKGTTFAAQTAATAAAKKARKLGLERFRVKIKGVGPGRQYSLKGLDAGGLIIVSIQDVTPIPHNGCKPRKARRL